VDPFDFDYLVIGSGFGGSVAALRLTEKGYRVAVVERCKRWQPGDFPLTNYDVRKFLWAPRLRCFGIQAITVLRDVLILHGSGVGGGSLVYAGVLLVPPDDVFDSPPWSSLGDWKTNLAPHYATAERMLGVATAQCQSELDHMLREIAVERGRGESCFPTRVGIFFGTPGATAPDPYFGGDGPERTGCALCSACMTGCRHNAKNTLDKNYLYLAEKNGAKVVAQTEVREIREAPDGGYLVRAVRLTDPLAKRRCEYRVRGVVVAGGVLGTVPLLLRCKKRGWLPRISDRLGDLVRTNSEALVGATSRRNVDYSKGVAIASGFAVDDETNVEMVRYGRGYDFMSRLCTVLVGGGPPWPRPLRLLAEMVRRPLVFLRLLYPIGWAPRTGILLVMQSIQNHMRLTLRRRWYWPFAEAIDSDWYSSHKVPKYFPVANELAERLAAKIEGDAAGTWLESLLSLTATAHILGGCPMGSDATEGVVDKLGRLFGHEDFYVADGSILPVNLRVNPSLTIAALAEWIASHIPEKDGR